MFKKQSYFADFFSGSVEALDGVQENTNTPVNYGWGWNFHEGIDRHTVSNDLDAAIADWLELQARAKVSSDLYNAIVDHPLTTSAKNSAASIDENGVVKFKGFLIQEIPDELFQTSECCYAYIEGVRKAFIGINTAQTIESEDFDGMAFQGAGKASEYTLPDNKKAVVKVLVDANYGLDNLTVTSAASATTSGKTKITISPALTSGNSYKYKVRQQSKQSGKSATGHNPALPPSLVLRSQLSASGSAERCLHSGKPDYAGTRKATTEGPNLRGRQAQKVYRKGIQRLDMCEKLRPRSSLRMRCKLGSRTSFVLSPPALRC